MKQAARCWLTVLIFVVDVLALGSASLAQLANVGLSPVRAQKFGNEVLPDFAPASLDDFAYALAAGDFNGDGAEDLATGLPGDDGRVDFTISGCGAVVVRYGAPGRGLATGFATTFLNQQEIGSPDPAQAGEGLGWALAACDFNGDQIDDLAIGIPWNRVSNIFPGSVEIHYGAASGLAAVAAQVFSQATVGVPGDAAADDRFGYSLACGDFNGDGRDDLAIGIPRKMVNLATHAGQVVILPGSASGLTATGSIALDQDTPGMGGTAEAGDSFGWSLAVGRINGDPYADLAIGIPGETDVANESGHGAVQLVYGSASGLTTAGNLYFNEAFLGGAPEASDAFGWTLASADFDGDGFDDLAIGVPYESLGILHSLGAVGEAFGSAAGLSSNRAEIWDQDRIYGVGASEPNDYFGYALAAGDFDGDGYADLAVGHPGEQNIVAGDGSATVLMGSSGFGLTASRHRNITPGYSGFPGPANQLDRSFGIVLTAGDFDGDGFADLALGAPYEDANGLTDVGTETVLFGALFADGFDGASAGQWSSVAP